MLEIAGIELLPPLPTFLGFVVAGLALNFVPGADMTFIIASAARHGRKAGIVAALGIGAGTLAHIAAAVLGLSALLASSQAAFNLLKWAGAAYLLYLGITMIRSGGATKPAHGPDPPRQSWRLFRSAALVNLLNPKVAIFFLAFLPQFVSPTARVPALEILCLGLWFDAVGTLVNIIVAIASAGAATRLRRFDWVGRVARWAAGFTMAALALKLALTSRERVPA